MKKLLLLCFLVVFSANFYGQEAAVKATKAKTEASAKKEKQMQKKKLTNLKKQQMQKTASATKLKNNPQVMQLQHRQSQKRIR